MDPRIQVLRAKLETHLAQFRPKRYAHLKETAELDSYLDSRALEAWEILRDASESGYSLDQAEEFIADILYPATEGAHASEPAEPDPILHWFENREAIKVMDGGKSKLKATAKRARRP